MTKERQEIIASFDAFDYQGIVKTKWRLLKELAVSLVDRGEWILYFISRYLTLLALALLIVVAGSWTCGFCLAVSVQGFITGLKWSGILLKAH
jgi:ABC-type multidrug transport system permease subunit